MSENAPAGNWSRRQVLSIPVFQAASGTQGRRLLKAEQVRRYPAPEATQAVAVDATCIYAIGNTVIGKYDKSSGRKLAEWRCSRGQPLIHLNSGIVRNGVLYCAHSNFPGVPMVSSIEMWDAGSLQPTSSHSFGILAGSATWIGWRRGQCYVCFGHYGKNGAEPGRDPRWTVLAELNADWQIRQTWVLPEALLERLGAYTLSGGVFLSESELLCTGHDEAELYLLSFPAGGSVLELRAVIPSFNTGQGIAWDPASPGTLYGIQRPNREVVVMRLLRG